MANIILPQVNILSEVNDSTNVLVEQDGVIQRVNASNFAKNDENILIEKLPIFEYVSSEDDFTNENRNYVLPNGTVYNKEYTLQYENKLSSALNVKDMTQILIDGNNIGFIENHRWSGSSADWVKITGWDSTGWIPCAAGDIIRFSNMTFATYTDSINDDRGCFALIDIDGNDCSSAQLKGPWTGGESWAPVLENNNCIQMTVPNWTSNGKPVAYIRFTAQDINSSSVITVNEEIENNYVYKWKLADYRFYDKTDETTVKNLDKSLNSLEEKITSLETNSDNAFIPDYWLTALKTGAEHIQILFNNVGRNKSAFLHYSDVHWTANAGDLSPMLLKYLYQNTPIRKVFFTGDLVAAEGTDYATMSYIWEWRKAIKDLPYHYSVPGNHDDGNATEHLFSTNYVYSFLMAAEENNDVVRENDMWYYLDDKTEKTRYIFLDTAYLLDNYQLSSQEETFLKETLLSTPAGYHIIPVAHIWYGPDYDRYDERPVPIKGLSDPAISICTILDNYNARSGEFSSCQAKVEFCIGGHVHYDYVGSSPNGIPIILVETAGSGWRGNYEYQVDSINASAVSCHIVDWANQKVTVVRVGRGSSFEVDLTTGIKTDITFTSGIPLYTNILTEVGYKEGYRLSGSSGNETKNVDSTTGAAITDITGWIPYDGKSIIYMKNIITEANNSYAEGIWHYQEDKTFINGYAIANTIADCLTRDANGNITSFRPGMHDPGVRWIRLSVKDITEDSIISVGVPINA